MKSTTRCWRFLLVLLICMTLLPTLIVGGSAAHCTAYTSKLGCEHYPPINRPLPICGAQSAHSGPATRFIVIGDHGYDAGQCLSRVRGLISALAEEFGEIAFVVGLGDMAYWSGDCDSLNTHTYAPFKEFFDTKPQCKLNSVAQTPRYDASTAPRFYPTLGNHDWDEHASNESTIPYVQFFNHILAFNGGADSGGQWYSHSPHRDIQLISLNSNLLATSNTKDTTRATRHAKMLEWTKGELSRGQSAFAIVFFHHPPHSTAQHDRPADWMRFHYGKHGASIVLTAHQHAYERMTISADNDIPYIVNGLGGHSWRYDNTKCEAVNGSQIRYDAAHGVMLATLSYRYVTAGWDEYGDNVQEKSAPFLLPTIDWCFYSLEKGGTIVDHFVTTSRHGVVDNV